MNIFKSRNSKKNKSWGFTLIELLVVISIISLLSSVVLVALKEAKLKSNDAKIAQELRQFKIAMELYYNDNKTYNVVALNDLDKNSTAYNYPDPTFKFNSLFAKIAEAAPNTKCTKFDEIAGILVTKKYLSKIPVHPYDNDTAGVCYKAFVDATNGSYFAAYAPLSVAKTPTGATKETGFILGDISVANLSAIYTGTSKEYPSGTTAGIAPTSIAAVVDEVQGLTVGNSDTPIATYTLIITHSTGGYVMYSPTSSHNSGTSLTITSVPNNGYITSYWSECQSYSGNTCYVTMNSNKTIFASFNPSNW